MNVTIAVKYLISARFEVFFHIPDENKRVFFRTFVRAPFHDPHFCQILNQIFAVNQYQLLKQLLQQMRQQKRLVSFGSKDVEQILELFWDEPDPELASRILLRLFSWNTNTAEGEYLFRMSTNLLFSASCRQDKEAALCILEE